MGEEYYYKGKKIGVIDSQHRLIAFKNYKMVFRQFNSLGFEETILSDLKNKGIKKILIIFKKEDKTEELFTTNIIDWKFGRVWKDANYEVQRHISIPDLREITKTLVD